MNIHLECIPCFLRQSLTAAQDLNLDRQMSAALMRRTLELALQVDWALPPPVIGRDIHRTIREVTGNDDPYLDSKIAATETALALLPTIEKSVAAAADPFLAAIKISIAGNIIDLGAKTNQEIDIPRTASLALAAPVDEVAAGRLRLAVAEAKNVLFLADNAGEIVFDRPLLKLIGADKITIVVRGGPTINDAVLDDARRSGLTDRYNVIDNGSDTPGTWLDDCSEDFRHRFDAADLVLAKGQGNFETLSQCHRSVWFLLMAKCQVISEDLGVERGSFVLRDKL